MFTRADEIKQFDGYLDEKNRDGEGRKGRWSRRKRDKEEEVGGVKKNVKYAGAAQDRGLFREKDRILRILASAVNRKDRLLK